MPHGVLFRGGKEKLIREIFIEDDIIEAIISLPPGLFYGTGIPACVLVVNKNKPDDLKDKILFINADREYAEGKAQNKLRPEDIEKIDYVFTNKIEIEKYSRLVEKTETVSTHDYNLNIRRYVDNTPEPEPEDVQAHLIGGIPKDEVEDLNDEFMKFGLNADVAFDNNREGYLQFNEHIKVRSDIRVLIDGLEAVDAIYTQHNTRLAEWWDVAKENFSGLRNGKKMPEVRLELLKTIKDKLISLGTLGEFQTAGVFVNWWGNIKYDLKTIISTGWHHSLIPDNYLIKEFFQNEADEIESIENIISELENELSEAIDEALEESSYELDEEESLSLTLIKKIFKDQIKDLKDNNSVSAVKEKQKLEDHQDRILGLDKRIKDNKSKLKKKANELELKIQLKRLGSAEFIAENTRLIQQIDKEIGELDPENSSDKRKINALKKDKNTLQSKIDNTDKVLLAIGGQITEEKSKELILKKLYDQISDEMIRYLNVEKRQLIGSIENLWDKYSVSKEMIEIQREDTLEQLNNFLKGLGYLR